MLTNQRLVFQGNQENRIIPLKKIISVELQGEWLEVSSETRGKNLAFSPSNPYQWAAAIKIISQVKDPLSLEGINLNLTLD